MPSELMQIQADDGSAVLIEVDTPDAGFGEVSFDGRIFRARESLEQALGGVRTIALKALDTFRAAESAPESIELEFGVKFKAEAGSAVFARTAAEGHIVVRMSWSGGSGHPVGRPSLDGDDDEDQPGA
ncbi:CU044_2847 family protein [Actinoplanes sp. Pm04-4]|uniref:CU044_2847 family protein n=1 Tax=Paractinoplanes pyxinae TaxID=2997416 RepID=A0ABT4B3W0_9ACTN|nr:CU044_2847 family protein [Actinoplanes pyxinae]MCY1141184.1 CU044_2847 family protein [Actinoplanes pyxinae]